PQVVSAAKLPILNPNEFDLWKMRIEQYFLMTDYSLWEVILNGDSPAPTRVVDGVLQSVAPTTAKQRLARKNELKARGSSSESLDQIHDRLQKLISQLKILGVSLSQEDINLKFLRSLPSDWRTHTLIWRNKTDLEEQSLDDFTNEPISAAASVSAVSAKIHVSALPNINADDLEEMDLKWQMAMLTYDGMGSYDWSFQVEEEPTNYALMAFSSSSFLLTMRLLVYQQNEYVFEEDIKLLKLKVQLRDNALVSLRQNLEKAKHEMDDLKLKLEKFQTSSKNSSELLASQINDKTCLGYNSQVFTRAMFDCDDYLSSGSDKSLPPSHIYDRYQSGNGYHAVPPPYTGTFMPPKPNLVFNNAPNDVETDHPAFTVTLSLTKPDQALSHTHRPSAPIIEDWHVETSIPTATPKTAILKPTSNGKSRNRKTCFVCKSLDYLIKDYDYHEKKMAQPTARNHGKRGSHQHYAKIPFTTDVPKIKVTRPRQDKPFVTKPNSPLRRHIYRGPSLKASNSPPRVTAVMDPIVNAAKVVLGKWEWKPKCPVLDHVSPNTSASMTLKRFDYNDALGRSKSGTCPIYLILKSSMVDMFLLVETQRVICDKKNSVLFTDTECLVLSPEFKLPDANQVLLRVPRENNIYNVNLKNIVLSGDLTCLFAKATLEESNLWHRRLGHINFKTMNKLVKGNLVRGLPSKVFENDNTCVACKKGKQHRASCLENQLSLKVKVIKSDNETEFKNNDLNQFYGMKGIKREFSVPRTPQQNGIAERKNRTLVEAARTMLADSLLPIPFWAEAVNTACYVQNRVLVTKPHNKTPYELLHGRTPSKFDGKVDEGFLTGYSISSKAFRVFNCRNRIVQETLHVNFLENKPNVAGSGPTWLFDIDTLTKTMNYQPVTAGNQFNPSAGVQKQFDAKKAGEEIVSQYVFFPVWSFGSTNPQNTDGDAAFNEKELEFDEKKPDINTFSADGPSNVVASPTQGKSSCIDTSQLHDDPNMPKLEDITYSDDEDDVGGEADFNNLETSITEELLQFKMQKVWVLVDLPHGKRAIGTKWIFRNKKDERGIVVGNKARLVAQGHTQEEGIDYEEVFAPNARIEAIRLFLAYASFMGFMVYQIDVKSAFLYGTIKEEVYFCQPLGLEDPDYPDKVYKVMSSMGELTFFLGLQVKQKKDGIFIGQDKYVAEILRKFRLTDGKSDSTPIDTEKPLLKDPDGQIVSKGLMNSYMSILLLLAFCDYHNMIAILEKYEHNTDFYQIVDFVEASHLRYALTINPTVYVSHIRQFWSTARIETTDEGTKILATVNVKVSNPYYHAMFESKEYWFNEFSSNIPTALVCLATNRVYNFSKMIFDGMVRNVNNKVSKFLMYPRFLSKCLKMGQFGQITHTHMYAVPFHTRKVFTTLRVNNPIFSGRTVPLFPSMLVTMGEGSGTPTEPHHTPSPEAQQTLPTATSLPSLPPITTATIPTVIPTDTPQLRHYTRRARIAQSLALPTTADKPASPIGDASQGEACPTVFGLEAEQDRANIIKISTLPSDHQGIKHLEEMMTHLEKIPQSKGGEVATVSILLAGEIPTISVPTGSGMVPIASLIYTTATESTPYTRRKGKEKMVESDTPKKKKLQEQIDIQVAREMEEHMVREDQRRNE
nr:hypothetical protein [Tanacetum cinerariifolium]